MASNQVIKYAPQCGDLTVESLTFHNNNVVGVFNYPTTTPAYHEIFKYLMNCPLAEAFTKTPSVVYQNLLREFWYTVVATHPNPPTDDSKVRPLKEYKIKFTTMNGKKPLTLNYKTFVESTRLDYAKGTYVSHSSPEAVKAELAKIVVLGENYSSTKQVNSIQQLFTYLLLGPDYTQDESLGSSPTILSNSNFSKDPSKVTPIELTDFMVAVNKHEHSVNPLPFSVKKKKGKSQTQSHSVSSGTIPDPQDLERNIQFAGTGLPSILNEGTPNTDPKDSKGNVQPADKELSFTASDESVAKTTQFLEGLRGEKDLEGLKPPADMKQHTNHVADPSRTNVNDDEEVFAAGEDLDEDEGICFVGDDMEEDTQS
ncbi:hypothetical protein Tco_0784777 [Tanacetum coccineum]